MVVKAKSRTVRFLRTRSDTVLRRRRPDDILGPDQRHGLVEYGRVMWADGVCICVGVGSCLGGEWLVNVRANEI